VIAGLNDIYYELWDWETPVIPERSSLFHLEPVGVGTPNVESLTSYLTRLAYEHCVPLVKLVLTEVAPRLQENYVPHPEHTSLAKVYGERTHALNGVGTMAASLVQVLEALTLRSDLRFLTLLSWNQVIPQRGLLRSHRAWCPSCYQQQRLKEQVIYDPLLWSLATVEVCSHHHQRLLSECPHCHKQLSPLVGRNRPGYCPQCGEWLGSFPNTELSGTQVLSEDELRWQTYVVGSIGELLAAAPHLSSLPTRDRIATATSACINQVAEGNVSALACLVGVPQWQMYTWYSGTRIPVIDSLLQWCCTLEISLLDFLTAEAMVTDCKPKTTLLQGKQKKPYKKLNRDTRQALRKALQKALSEYPPPSLKKLASRLEYYPKVLTYNYPALCNQLKVRYANYKKIRLQEIQKEIQTSLEAALKEEPPASLLEISKRFGYKGSAFLYSLFPELCYQISTRHEAYQETCTLKNREKRCQEVRQIAFQLHEQGIEPNTSNVAKLLTKPGGIRRRDVQITLREVRRELGYE
jgi:hypothetical protein